MRSCLALSFVALACGCSADAPPPAADRGGVAELRLSADPSLAGVITRVTVEAAQASADLQPGAAEPDTFAGTLVLAAGPHSLVVRAFADTTQVGASNPIAVTVTAGVVTRVTARILDQREAPGPIFGPVFDSLSAPTTIAPGAPAAFQVSVLAPAGDPVAYAWSSSCQDGTFSDPTAAATTWSSPTIGVCTITVAASSRGFVVTRSFAIAVQDDTGTVDIGAVFVSPPSLILALPGLGCSHAAGSRGNASCDAALAAPERAAFDVVVPAWGQSAPGTLELTDDCGGATELTSSSLDARSGTWTPPAAGGLCILTARAVNADGLHSATALAVLARPGARVPTLSAQLTGCPLQPAAAQRFCGALPSPNVLIGSVVWPDLPGALRAIDSCFGELPLLGPQFAVTWTPNAGPGSSCTVELRATAPGGASTAISATYLMPFPVCGNGRLEPGEQCDDGNTVNGDTCEANCTIAFCGNAILDGGEQCDDGNAQSGDGCEADCTFTPTAASAAGAAPRA